VLTFTSRDLQRRIGQIQDLAMKQPVSITRNGRESFVIVSVDV
jgi:prevent-host-death family protein